MRTPAVEREGDGGLSVQNGQGNESVRGIIWKRGAERDTVVGLGKVKLAGFVVEEVVIIGPIPLWPQILW